MPSSRLESRLRYEFRNAELLRQADPSYCATHNERLEFLGDSVLNCAVAAFVPAFRQAGRRRSVARTRQPQTAVAVRSSGPEYLGRTAARRGRAAAAGSAARRSRTRSSHHRGRVLDGGFEAARGHQKASISRFSTTSIRARQGREDAAAGIPGHKIALPTYGGGDAWCAHNQQRSRMHGAEARREGVGPVRAGAQPSRLPRRRRSMMMAAAPMLAASQALEKRARVEAYRTKSCRA